MAVMTRSLKPVEIKMGNKKSKKSFEKCRPITATLEHPLILDIKLLQKLDMTTFTKRGLVALSKFCGISLITHKAGSNTKLIKSIQGIENKTKQMSKGGNCVCPFNDGCELLEKKEAVECNRILAKPKFSKFKPQFNFQIVELEENVKSVVSQEKEESADVPCKKHPNGYKNKNSRQKHRKQNRKSVLDDRSNEIVPEPCKSCNRTQHPERLHSHPKLTPRVMKVTEGRLKSAATTKDTRQEGKKVLDKSNIRGKSFGAKGLASAQNANVERSATSPTSKKCSFSERSESPKKGASPLVVQESSGNFRKKIPIQFPVRQQSNVEESKQTESKTTSDSEKSSSPHSSANEGMQYITGCYICGIQVSPKARMKHEKECISEWRNQNSLLSPENRRPEPKRPDYRFTGRNAINVTHLILMEDPTHPKHKDVATGLSLYRTNCTLKKALIFKVFKAMKRVAHHPRP
ncbi:hypothetical protein RUM44_005574 [Polyplax serrata]|uniref:UBZ4-type domain-containing protein n=1 Tax=Polyplax serrata TaxID=468196 RepID=A0ABR1ADS6_POLSC